MFGWSRPEDERNLLLHPPLFIRRGAGRKFFVFGEWKWKCRWKWVSNTSTPYVCMYVCLVDIVYPLSGRSDPLGQTDREVEGGSGFLGSGSQFVGYEVR